MLKLFSHQNLKGNSILHEAVSEDRDEILSTLKLIQFVKQDIKNNKGFTYEELSEHFVINTFVRRYQDTLNEIKNRKRKKSRCSFWSKDSDQEEDEESINMIKLKRIDSAEERRRKQTKALM